MRLRSWRDVVATLKNATSPATQKQLDLATRTGVEVERDTPRLVVGAQLRSALAEELCLPPSRPVSERTKSLVDILRQATEVNCAPSYESEAEAWVLYLRLLTRLKSLEEKQPDPGDVVHKATGEPAIISSIGEDGRLYFKGGQGFGAWPDQIVVKARASETGRRADDLRRKAANWTAQRARTALWSLAKGQELSEFLVTVKPSESDVDELERVIESADDERPVQKFLELHPHLLTSLVSGHACYCIPLKRLGAEYVPDFVLGSVDSLGVYWVLVELESPKSTMYLKNGKDLAAGARKGINQVHEWRGWLTDNLEYARRRRAENGLGLLDIRPSPPAVVLISRRSSLSDTNESVRHQLRESNRIHLHTYDWLVDALGFAQRSRGLPTANPFLVSRELGDPDA